MRPRTVRAAALALGALLLEQAARPGPARTLALTFDDVPLQSGDPCQSGLAARVNRGLLTALARRKAPATAFVTGSRGCTPEQTAGTLREWKQAGHVLGNHTWSHGDLNAKPAAEYQRDVLRGDDPVRSATGSRPVFFRHPFLHAGPTADVKSSMDRFFRDNGYRIAPVTIDNQEWVFAAVYRKAADENDSALRDRVAREYIAYMERVTGFFEERGRSVLGREPAQILLLHANLLNAEHLDALLAMFERRGYRFVPVEEAMRDEAYRIADGYAGPKGLSWIHRWGLSLGKPVAEEPREPAWLTQALAGR